MIDLREVIRQIWPEWTVEKQIGRGAFGQVFQAVRGELGFETRCAIKVIAVPPDPSDAEALRLEGMPEEEIRQYYQRLAESFAGEIRMLYSLKGAPHIVGIEDYWMTENPDDIGWNLLIRMELLKPLPAFLRERPFTEADTLRLGSELCEALDICHELHVLHRDIKPQNIFVDRFGSFRLGDFGIARKMESLTVSMSQKGTYGYIAPEVNNGKHYDERADIYSLGLVMYQLTNLGRLPFLSSMEEARKPEKRAEALQRRLQGEELPPPCAASPELSEIILKACRYVPEERFRNAAEMKKALHRLMPEEDDIPVDPLKPEEAYPSPVQQTQDKPEKSNHGISFGTPDNRAEAERTKTDTSEPPVLKKEEEDNATLSAKPPVMNGPAQPTGTDGTDEKSGHAKPDNLQKPEADDNRTFIAADGIPPHENGAKPAGKGKKTSRKGMIAVVAAVVLLAFGAAVWGVSAAVMRMWNAAESPEISPNTDPDKTEHSIDIETEGKGTASADCGAAVKGSQVTLNASPADGYVFKEWIVLSGNVEISGDTFTAGTEDVKLKAVFEEKRYTITVSDNGYGKAETDITAAVTGCQVTLNTIPKDGYAFKEWSVLSGGITIDGNTFTVGTEDVAVKAVFVKGTGGSCGDHLNWRYESDNGTLVICGSGKMSNYRIDGNGTNAPWNDLVSGFKTLVLEEGITSIGACAFYNCSAFTGSLTIPDSVKTIGDSAFSGCSGFTGSLTIPAVVENIGDSAFSYCSGFNGGLTIREGTASIGDSAFSNCSGFTGGLTIPQSVTTISNCAFLCCSGFTGELTVPESVRTIGNWTFLECGFSSARFLGPVPEVGPGENWGEEFVPGTEDIFSGAKSDDFTVFCTADNYDSFVNSAGYDAAAGTWYGYPLKTFVP